MSKVCFLIMRNSIQSENRTTDPADSQRKTGLIMTKWRRNRTNVMIAVIDIATDAFPNERADFGELSERPCATSAKMKAMSPKKPPQQKIAKHEKTTCPIYD